MTEGAGSQRRASGGRAVDRGRLHRWVIRVLATVQLAGAALAVAERQWLGAVAILAILSVTLLPARLSRRFDVFLPPEFELLAVLFLFASLFLGEVRGYYVRFWWWDAVLHAGSAVLLGILGFLLVYALNANPHVHLEMRPRFVALFSFAFAVAAGTLWEIFEFAADGLFGLNMQKSGLVDTMWDLIVDTLGAAAMALLGYAYLKSGETSFLERWIAQFIEANPRLFGRG